LSLIVDASIVVKWAIQEDGHAEAIALIDSDHDIVVPEFLHVEVGNALWKKVRRKEIAREQALAAAEAIGFAFNSFVHTPDYIERALELSFELDHPIYDCVYLAAALERDLKLVTADGRFMAAVARGPYESWVMLLSGSAP
jgi:predicted nucleic acid-binding protein